MRQSTPTIVIGRRALLREGVASLLQRSTYRVLAGAPSASDLKDVHLPVGQRPLVICGVDGNNESYDDVAANFRSLRSMFSGCKIVVIAETSGTVDLQRILVLAPDAFILNLGSRDILLRSLELTLLDQRVLVFGNPNAPPLAVDVPDSEPSAGPPDPAQRSSERLHPASGINHPSLSHREQQVITYLAQGYSNKAIARSCSITESTVKVHLKTILRKVKAQNRTQAAIWAVAHGYKRGSLAERRSSQTENRNLQTDDRPSSTLEQSEASSARILSQPVT